VTPGFDGVANEMLSYELALEEEVVEFTGPGDSKPMPQQ